MAQSQLFTLAKQLMLATGVSYEHAVHELLALQSVIASKKYKIRHPFSINTTVGGHNFFVLVARSGWRKTTVQSLLLGGYAEVMAEEEREYEKKMLEYKESNKILMIKEEQEKTPPFDPNFFVTEGTQEGLMYLLSNKNKLPILYIRSSEGEGFFQDMGGVKQTTKMCILLNSVWSGEIVSKVLLKTKRAIMTRPEARAVLDLCMKEETFMEYIATEDNKANGFLARALICIVKEAPKKTNCKAKDIEELLEYIAWVQKEFKEMKQEYAITKNLKARILDYDEKVRKRLLAINEEILIKINNEWQEVEEIGLRAFEHLLRLIVILKSFESEASLIQVSHVETAYNLVKFYVAMHIKETNKDQKKEEKINKIYEKVVSFLKHCKEKYISNRSLHIHTNLSRHKWYKEEVINLLIENHIIEGVFGQKIQIEGKICTKAYRIIKQEEYAVHCNSAQIQQEAGGIKKSMDILDLFVEQKRRQEDIFSKIKKYIQNNPDCLDGLFVNGKWKGREFYFDAPHYDSWSYNKDKGIVKDFRIGATQERGDIITTYKIIHGCENDYIASIEMQKRLGI